MHTWKHGSTAFTGNSDLSGDLVVTDGRTGASVAVPAPDVIALVADHVRRWRMSEIERDGAGTPDEIGAIEGMDDLTALGIARP